MHKYFITYEKERSFYAYRNSSNVTALKTKEIEGILEYIAKSSILDLREIGENALEIIFAGNVSIMIDDIRVFEYNNNQFDSYIKNLQKRITTYSERKAIESYNQKLPHGYKPRVNRHKKRKGRVIATGLSLVVLINLGLALNKELSKSDKQEFKKYEISYELPKAQMPSYIPDEVEINTPEINLNENIELAFEDRTESGKLEETILYCGNEIKYYSERYGLPYEVCCAQITQERDTKEGWMNNNPCQITYDLFVGRKMHIPVYDESGFTGEYDDFTITKEMLDTKEGNIMVAIAYDRICVDKFESLSTGVYSYNQGEYALNLACDEYELDINDYKGDSKTLEAKSLIDKYFQEKNELRGKSEAKHGDPLYLEHVFSYLPLDQGTREISYYIKDKLITVDLTNINVYNNEFTRG